jgi:hypothetical protein
MITLEKPRIRADIGAPVLEDEVVECIAEIGDRKAGRETLFIGVRLPKRMGRISVL